MARTVAAVILAAGKGTRMKSERAKVLHEVAGRPMIDHVLDAVHGAGVDDVWVVVGYRHEEVSQHMGDRAHTVVQDPQLGTGHAVLQTENLLSHGGDILVVAGDIPLVTSEVLDHLVSHHRSSGGAATLLSAIVDDPTGYGRIVRDQQGAFECIVEQADIDEGTAEATAIQPDELGDIREVNTSICCARGELLFDYLHRLQADNAQGEYYLVDIFDMMRRDRKRVEVFVAPDPSVVMGVNDRIALAEASSIVHERINRRWMLEGVTLVDPETTHIDARATIGRDTVIAPFTVIRGDTKIGENCEIGPGADIIEATIGDSCTVVRSTVENSTLGRGVKVGPYSHLRPHCRLADDVKVGNYAELKNSTVGVGSKISHHSYIGDTDMGADVNMGAGVVTVNYDGYNKHRTIIEDRAFVGCNVNLIAPVRIEEGAYVAAGSTITRDVPRDNLGVGRARQENLEGWVQRWHRRHQKPSS